MKKILAGFVFLFCLYLLKTSVSEESMKDITDFRYQTQGIFSSPKYIYGDLFGISYLNNFKKVKKENLQRPSNIDLTKKDISLYFICDSYVFGTFEGKNDYFSRAESVQMLKWKDPKWDVPKLTNKHKKVLIVEMVLRNLYSDMNIKNLTSRSDFSNLIQSSKVESVPTSIEEKMDWFGAFRRMVVSMNQWVMRTFYHKNIESHLEFILFDFDFLLNLKMWKSELLMNVFNRVNGSVVLSKDRQFLFMENTVSKTHKGSAAYPITDLEIEEQVGKINELDLFFKSKGFNYVLFSIIPNPYDLVGNNEFGQNDQLNRILTSPKLKANMLNISPKLSVNARNNFFPSDTHWNSNGAYIWLFEVNNYLNSIPQ